MIYLFDVDGTLTEPLETIRPEMVEELRRLAQTNPIYLVAGSDAGKVLKQIPAQYLHDTSLFSGWFCCSGAEFYVGDAKQFSLPVPTREKYPEVFVEMERFLHRSKFSERTGNHLELRPGMVNLSTVGRNAIPWLREKYNEWDKARGERQVIAIELERKFKSKGISCAIGGMISIDVYFDGFTGKSSAVRHLQPQGISFVYFGDKTEPGGNDYSAVRYIEENNLGRGVQVRSCDETLRLLKLLKLR